MISENIFKSDMSFEIEGALNNVKSSKNLLAPILEALVNSIEANATNISLIIEKQFTDLMGNAYNINLSIYDDGDGFNDFNYNNFQTLFSTKKQQQNKGCGKLQFLHFFDNCVFQSCYNLNNEIKNRYFYFKSKSSNINGIEESPINCDELKFNILNDKNIPKEFTSRHGCFVKMNILKPHIKTNFENIVFDLDKLKEQLITMNFKKFILLRENMPNISIFTTTNKQDNIEIVSQAKISRQDVNYDSSLEEIKIPKVKIEYDNNNQIIFTNSNNEEILQIERYELPPENFKYNSVFLCAKNLAVQDIISDLDISKKAIFKGKRYICFISGDYLEKEVNQPRDGFDLKEKKDFKDKKDENSNLFPENKEYLLYYDVVKSVKNKFLDLLQELREQKQQKDNLILETANEQGLNEKEKQELLSSTAIRNDSTKDFIVKEAGKIRGLNLSIEQNKIITTFKAFNASDQNERQNLANEILNLVSTQNKNDLTQYVIRRQIEVELLNEFIKNNVIESCIHNLIFQKGTDNKTNSEHNLWMVNDDFANYDYITSESSLKEILDGNEISDDDIKNALKSYGVESDNEVKKRPDIAIFHAIKTVILIEFKKPDVLHSKYVYQLDVYTRLLAEFSKGKFDKFYCFLIGGDTIGILPSAYNFKETPDQEGFFSNINIKSLDNKREIGTMYMEVQKYSRLQKLAKLRNDTFAKKTGINIEEIMRKILSNKVEKEVKK